MNTFEWIKPAWKDRPEEDEDGFWPWVGDPFLAAVQVRDAETNKTHWEFTVVRFTERDIETAEGDPWGWSAGDIEWIARIPEPKGGGA